MWGLVATIRYQGCSLYSSGDVFIPDGLLVRVCGMYPMLESRVYGTAILYLSLASGIHVPDDNKTFVFHFT